MPATPTEFTTADARAIFESAINRPDTLDGPHPFLTASRARIDRGAVHADPTVGRGSGRGRFLFFS